MKWPGQRVGREPADWSIYTVSISGVSLDGPGGSVVSPPTSARRDGGTGLLQSSEEIDSEMARLGAREGAWAPSLVPGWEAHRVKMAPTPPTALRVQRPEAALRWKYIR